MPCISVLQSHSYRDSVYLFRIHPYLHTMVCRSRANLYPKSDSITLKFDCIYSDSWRLVDICLLTKGY